MKEALISGFIDNLGGKVGKEVLLFIISMVPILELRGGLLPLWGSRFRAPEPGQAP